MKIRELKELIKDIPDDVEIVVDAIIGDECEPTRDEPEDIFYHEEHKQLVFKA